MTSCYLYYLVFFTLSDLFSPSGSKRAPLALLMNHVDFLHMICDNKLIHVEYCKCSIRFHLLVLLNTILL